MLKKCLSNGWLISKNLRRFYSTLADGEEHVESIESTIKDSKLHIPVMLDEVLEHLVKNNKNYKVFRYAFFYFQNQEKDFFCLDLL